MLTKNWKNIIKSRMLMTPYTGMTAGKLSSCYPIKNVLGQNKYMMPDNSTNMGGTTLNLGYLIRNGARSSGGSGESAYDYYYGLIFEKAVDIPTVDDYTLQDPEVPSSSGLYITNTVINYVADNDVLTVTHKLTVNNRKSTAVTITGFGLFVQGNEVQSDTYFAEAPMSAPGTGNQNRNQYNGFLLERTLFDSPITFDPSETKVINLNRSIIEE